MNGKQQVEHYAKLVNSDQKAPASATWPRTQAGFAVGDRVMVQLGHSSNVITGTITKLLPPSLVLVKAPSGKEFKAGIKAVKRV